MNLITVIKTRPQIIKSVLVSQELRKHWINNIHLVIINNKPEIAYRVDDYFGDVKAHIKISEVIIEFLEKAGSTK
jgi:UDP-N-acetylglucosamine 2-epimerase